MKEILRGISLGIGFSIVLVPLLALVNWLTFDRLMDRAMKSAQERLLVDQSHFKFEESQFESDKNRTYMATTLRNISEDTYWDIRVRVDVTESDGYPVDTGLGSIRTLPPGESRKVYIPIGYERREFTDHWDPDIYVDSALIGP